jgi:hypothetical protein
MKYQTISQTLSHFINLFSKASIAIQVLRLFGSQTHWRRWIIIGLTILNVIITLGTVIVHYAKCTPPRAQWEKVPGATCWKNGDMIDQGFGLALTGE